MTRGGHSRLYMRESCRRGFLGGVQNEYGWAISFREKVINALRWRTDLVSVADEIS